MYLPRPKTLFWAFRENWELKEAQKKIQEICDKYGFHIDLNKKIYEMSVSEKQTVEIVKVLYRGVNILILDEPTAVLTPQETEKLFLVMWRMRNDGKSIIIITHKMHEVKEISDRVMILRKGRYIAEMNTEDSDIQEMTDMMVGRSVTLNIERKTPVDPKPKIVVENLTILDEEGVPKVNRCFVYGKYRGDSRNCRCFRLRTKRAFGGNCRSSESGIRSCVLCRR